MNYDQLKSLEMPTLFQHLQRTLSTCFDLTPDQFTQGIPMPSPVLFQIGDFEIRARFQDPAPGPDPIPSNPEDLYYIDILQTRCARHAEEIVSLKTALAHHLNNPPPHPPAVPIPRQCPEIVCPEADLDEQDLLENYNELIALRYIREVKSH